jgi:hypothetical protein
MVSSLHAPSWCGSAWMLRYRRADNKSMVAATHQATFVAELNPVADRSQQQIID